MTVPSRPFDPKLVTPYVCQWCGNPVPLMVDTEEELMCPYCGRKKLKKQPKETTLRAAATAPTVSAEARMEGSDTIVITPKAEYPAQVGPTTKVDGRALRGLELRGKTMPKTEHCPYCGKMMAKQGFEEHKNWHIRKGHHITTVVQQESRPGVGIIEEPKTKKPWSPMNEREIRDHNENYARQ